MTSPVRIGINGFGRIGRCLFKNALARGAAVAGINDLADLGDLAYLLKYDSVHGWWDHKVSHTDKELVVDGVAIPFFSTKEQPRS
jgi:glyceraldehyde 3-phosphate dehydrogenase